MRALAKVLLFVLAIFCTSGTWAQTTGTITGTVKDSTGAVIPGTAVSIRNEATAAQRSATTNNSGEYSFPSLEPGRYEFRFTSSDFAPLIRHVTLNVTERIAVDAVLQVSGSQQQVTVTSGEVLLQTQDNTLGRVIDGTAIRNMPLATRNFTQVLALSPGTSTTLNDATALGRGTQEISSNGARTGSNAYYVDGVDATNVHVNSAANNTLASNGVVTPSPEAIQEFKVQTGLYDALAGRSGGANVALVTRSGTNQFHGDVFEYFRNDALNANLYFLNQQGKRRPVLKQNQFGGTIGGPVLKNKLFFFFSYQGTRQINGIAGTSTLNLPQIPTVRTAQTLGAAFAGKNTAITTPATPNAATVTSVSADGSNISPVAIAMLNLKNPDGSYVLPSPQTSNTSGVNYGISIPSTFKEDQYIDAVDYQISNINRLSFKSIVAQQPQFNPLPSANVPGFGVTQAFKSRLYSLTDTHIFTPNIVNEARMGVSRTIGSTALQSAFPLTSIGMTRFNSGDFPDIPSISITGSFSLGYNVDADQADNETTWQYFDDLSWTKGKHQIQTGGEFRRYQDNYFDNNRFRGTLTFHSFPDFLLGLSGAPVSTGGNGTGNSNVYSASVASGTAARNDRISDYAFFAQDSWRFLSTLTLNYGLRWEYVGLPVDRYGRNGSFDIRKYVAPAPGTFTSVGFEQMENAAKPIPGLPTLPNTLTDNVNKLNFGPRIGLAFQARPWLNIRAGYGLTVDRASNQLGLRAALSLPNYERTTLTGTGNINSTFQNPFPVLPLRSQFPITPQIYGGVKTADGQGLTYPATIPALAINDIDPLFRTPYVQQYGLDVQIQAAPKTLLDIGYAGSHGVALPVENELNQAVLASPSHPVNGVTTTTSAAANVQARVPYIGFSTTGILYMQTKASSVYNSLQATVIQQATNGLQFQFSYDYSKSMDTMSGSLDGTTFNTFDGDQTNLAGNWGPSDYDRAHRIVVNAFYKIPAFGFGLNDTSFGKKIFNGWQVTGIGVVQSGLPFSVEDANGGSYYGVGQSRANFAPGITTAQAKLTGRTEDRLTHYFNTQAFVPAGGYYGNSGRNILRGPLQRNLDMSLIKDTTLHESLNIEFRSEFFNIMNYANFNSPDSSISSASSYGVISSTTGNPRVIQFALKLSF